VGFYRPTDSIKLVIRLNETRRTSSSWA